MFSSIVYFLITVNAYFIVTFAGTRYQYANALRELFSPMVYQVLAELVG